MLDWLNQEAIFQDLHYLSVQYLDNFFTRHGPMGKYDCTHVCLSNQDELHVLIMK